MVILLCVTVQHAQLVTVKRRCLPLYTSAVVRLQGMSVDACLPPQTMLWSDCNACVETLSPLADHCCGQTARHEWRRLSPSTDHAVVRLQGMSGDACLPPQTTLWSDCNAYVETLSPLADHCCGQTARHEWRCLSPSADHAVVRL